MRNIYAAMTALSAITLCSGSVLAQDVERPNYNFVGLQYVYGVAEPDSTIDALDDATDGNWYYGTGGQLDASYALNDQFLFRGSYYTGSGDYRGGPDIDFSTAVVGIGVIAPTDDAVGIDASLEYRLDDIEFDNEDDDIDGLGISFGVRANVTEAQEVSFRIGVYAGDFDQSVGLQLGYAYNFSDRWGITAAYEHMDASQDTKEGIDYKLNKWMVGGRFYF